MRILITDASGCGTTTLGRALADKLRRPFFDLDDYYWLPTEPPYLQKRHATQRLSMLLQDLDRAGNAAVLAGSVVHWGAEIEDSFSLIVFLRVATEIRVDRLRKREADVFGTANPTFLEWAAQYDEGRLPGRSLAIHEHWLSLRRCLVLRIEGDVSVSDSMTRIMAIT